MMSKMRVLLADDSDLILERLKEVLCSLEQVEIVASLKNGNEALEALKVLKPELAIVDIKMPGLNGLEILNEIRKDNKAIKFIVLTLFASEYYRQLADLAGADYFFSKVDDFEKVSIAVVEVMSNLKNNYRYEKNTDNIISHN
jgi:DNA-binding NarL/FixJ family response regulator